VTRDGHARLGGYELGEPIGQGGMAMVYSAYRLGPRGFRKRVALKRILPHLAADARFVAMFVQEAAIASQIEHPNVVQVFDFGEERGELYLAMEFVAGTSIGRVLRAIAARGEAVSIEVAVHLAAQAARALAHAHALRDAGGVPLALVHRDVSPGNLLVTHTGHLKLGDFGIARTTASESFTAKNRLRGKIGYVSPEQVRGEPLDGRSDVFALSTVLAEMLTGRALFAFGSEADVLVRIRDADLSALARAERPLPGDMRRVLFAGLAPDPRDRPGASELADLLEGALARRGVATGGPARTAHFLAHVGLAPGPSPRSAAALPVRDSSAVPGAIARDVAAGASASGGGARARVSVPDVPRKAVYTPVPASGRIGPVAFPELVRLCTTGVVAAATPVQREGQPTRPAGELAELGRIFGTPALQWHADELATASMRGELRAAVLLPLIHNLHARKATGVLYLEDEIRRKKIYFVDGRPDFVASTMRDELLGHHLVRERHCLPMEVDMGLALMPQFGGRLGDALVDLGALRPVELYRAVSSQVRARYLEAFRWRMGNWRYAGEKTCGEATYPIEQDAHVLMRDACMQLHASELEAALSPMWETVVRRRANPPAPVTAFQPPDAWRWVLDRAGDAVTVGGLFGQVSRQSGLDGEDAMRAIFLGVSCGLLEAA
jgi:serine/threonine-protein kinase